MQGPAARRSVGSSGGSRVSSEAKTINICPSAPQNIRRLIDSVEAVIAKPARSYAKAWKAELDSYVDQFGVPKRHREVGARGF